MSRAASTIDAGSAMPIVRVLEAVRARHGASAVHGVARSLIVDDTDGWRGEIDVDDLVAAALVRWPAEEHVAATLAWKSYAYGAMLPWVIGYATDGMVPVAGPLVRLHGHDPFVEFGLATAEFTTTDPLRTMRNGIVEGHLLPLLDAIHERVHVGRRTLLGSIASGICHALERAGDVLPGPVVPTAYAILDALELADLVDFYPDADGRLTIARRTCCLAFALPDPKICRGCCIPTSPR
jgi:hypothetical protein